MRYEIRNFISNEFMKKSIWRMKWFTLVEVVITVVIMWVLIWLIFEIFVTIWRISVFVQLNRAVHGELIYVSQTIQNMVDDQEMYLTWLDITGTWGDIETFGWKQALRFSDDEFNYVISNNCILESNCYLELYWLELDPDYSQPEFIQSGSVALTDPSTVDISSFFVRTLPYWPSSDYIHMMHKWFWLFLDIRVPQYDETKWWYRVQQQVELFFTMRKYE